MQKALLLLFVLFSSSFAESALEYSTLNLTAADQSGNPLPRAEFFLKCKMSFATPERFLCASDVSGSCQSACMDCAPGVSAVVRGNYLNHTIEQNISSWKGIEGNCSPSSSPSNDLDIFTFTVSEEEKKLSQNETENEVDGASENIPVNTNIETKDFQLGSSNGSDTEYSGPTSAQDVKTGESCLPAFALIFSFLAFAGFRK
jgi:hypothetical protein